MTNVAFDFDGVIHKDVTKHDEYGHRHPIYGFNTIPLNPFTKIINLIRIYHKYKYNIYIITARNSNSKNIILETLKKFGLDKIINEKNIYFTGHINNGDKTNIIDELKINYFYDDSIYNFNSVYREKNKNKLKNLRKFYLTIPEKNTIISLKI
jgi:hypothetical protein